MTTFKQQKYMQQSRAIQFVLLSSGEDRTHSPIKLGVKYLWSLIIKHLFAYYIMYS